MALELAQIAKINIVHCFLNIFLWIIIKLGGNVCWLNPLAMFNKQPDSMKFSGVMALELTQILKSSTLSLKNSDKFSLFVGIISCQLIASSIQIIQIDSRHLLSYGRIL